MKHLLLAVAVASTMLMSCSGAKEQAATSADDVKAKIENCTNPDSVKLYVEEAVAYAQQLQKEGKLEEAKAYLNDLKATVGAKAPTLVDYFNKAVEAVEAVPGDVKEAVDGTVEEGKNVVDEQVDAAKDAANKAVDEAVNKANDKVNEQVDAAKDKGAEAVQNAADKLKAGMGR